MIRMLLVSLAILVAIARSKAENLGSKCDEQICQCEPHPVSYNEEFLSNDFTDALFLKKHCRSILSSLSCITNSLDNMCQLRNSSYSKSNYGFMNGIYAIINNLCLTLYQEESRTSLCENNNYGKCKSTVSFGYELEDKFLPSEEFLKEHCSTLLDSITCMKHYLISCGDDILKGTNYNTQVVALSGEILNNLCNEDSELRKVYSENVECINKYKDKYEGCFNDASRAAKSFKNYLMEINYENKDDVDTLFKCLGNRMIASCIMSEMVLHCGSGIIQGIEMIRDLFPNGIEDTLCPSQIIKAAMNDYSRYVANNPDPIHKFGFNLMEK